VVNAFVGNIRCPNIVLVYYCCYYCDIADVADAAVADATVADAAVAVVNQRKVLLFYY